MATKRTIKVKICKYCGKEFKTSNSLKKFCSRKCAGIYSYNNKKKPTGDTICWDCKRATGGQGCPWADKLEPVEGWEAEQTKIKYYLEEYASYKVKKCPLFKEG